MSCRPPGQEHSKEPQQWVTQQLVGHSGRLWVVSECFVPPRSKLGYAACYHPQQTNTVLILLISPDIFSASTTWACNRKIFFAERIRCRGRPTFCCKYCAEGYVVFTFLNANKKWKCYSWIHVASCPCLGFQHTVVALIPAGHLLAAGHPAFSPARRTVACRWDCSASSPAWFGNCEENSKVSTRVVGLQLRLIQRSLWQLVIDRQT